MFSLLRTELLILYHSHHILIWSFQQVTIYESSLESFYLRVVEIHALSFSFKIYTWTQDSTEYTMLVWNVTPAFQRPALNSIHLCFSVATRSGRVHWHAFLLLLCKFFFFGKTSWSHPQRLFLNKIVGGDGCEMCVFLKYGFHVTLRLCGQADDVGKCDDGARYSESGWMHHSLTGREQSPVRITQNNQQLFVGTEQCERLADKPWLSHVIYQKKSFLV